jgi:hypothetical protein
MLAAGVHPVAAQEVSPEACAGMKEQIRYLVNEGAFIRDAGLKEGVDLLANAILGRNAACGTPGDDSFPAPTPVGEPPPTPVPAPTPVFRAVDPIGDTDNSATRKDACLLVTEKEVGAAMKQGVVANEADPAGVEGAQGCEFNGVASAYTDIMYFQASAAFVYDAFHATAEANGVQPVPGLGDRAFTYIRGERARHRSGQGRQAVHHRVQRYWRRASRTEQPTRSCPTSPRSRPLTTRQEAEAWAMLSEARLSY